MKRSLLVLAVLTAALIGGLFCQPAPAGAAPFGDGPKWGHGEGREGNGERFLARMAKDLDLSGEQQEKIKVIMEEHRAKVAPLRQKLDDSREKLREASRAGAFDEAAVRSLAADQASVKTELTVERARMQSQVHALLTPEQQKLAEEQIDRMKERRGEAHHRKGCN